MAAGKVLVSGASGVLGWHLCRILDADPTLDVAATCRKSRPQFDRICCSAVDLARPEDLGLLERSGPYDVIVHTAAVTNPDECERDPDRARRVNVEATRELLSLLSPGGRFIYTSTDLVFDGCKGLYVEEDEPNPVNYYGETKLRAEEIVRRAPGGVVVRISKLYSNGSPFHPCFLTWMKERFDRGDEVPLFSDQYRSPLFIGDAVRGLRRLFDGSTRWNLYHLGGPERSNRYDFGCRYAEVFGYPVSRIRAVTMGEVGLVARGADCSFSSDRFSREFAFAGTVLEEGLRSLRAEESRESGK